MRLLLFLLGYCRVAVSLADATAFFELCRMLGITPKAPRRDEKQGVFFCNLTRREQRTLSPAAKARGVALRTVREGGAPLWLSALLHRPCLVVGILLALSVVVLSRFFVWEVQLDGNATVTDAELREELRQVGVAAGTPLFRLDGQAAAVALRDGDSRIAYAAITVRGTVVKVQIRESEPEPPSKNVTPANLVARCDGVVTIPLVFEGECLVKAGEVVRAGQILASGIKESENNGIRLTRAAGQVLAKTTKTYRVSVPLAYEAKSYTGRTRGELSLLFFGFSGKVFKSTGNLSGKYDIINKTVMLSAGDARELSFGYRLSLWQEYESVPATRTASEALTLGYAELNAQLAADAATRTPLSRTVSVTGEGGSITLICTVTYEEDIAAVAEFSVLG